MKKKIVSFITLAACVASLFTACGTPRDTVSATQKLSIVSTIFPSYDFARQIAGSHAQVTMLLHPGAESHSYEPTPQDIKTIQNCDLFIYTGGENDVWVDDILESMGDKKPNTLKMMDCVQTVAEEIVEGMQDAHDHEEEAHEDDHDHEAEPATDEHVHADELDEHVWTSPKNSIKIVEAITQEMVENDAANAAVYQENCNAYMQQLEELDAALREVVETSTRKTVLFGDRFPFRYLADEYGLSYYAAFSGCSTETEASAATIAFLADKVAELKLPVVFTIELSNGKIADSICEATGAQKLTLYSCHNVTKAQLEEGATYLSLMNQNVESLRTALN